MEEISLRELIEVLIKRKSIIIGLTILMVIASSVVSFFMLEPVYETRMVLMASNFSDRLQTSQQQGNGVDGILNNLSHYPSMTMETYKQQITAPRIMRETIADLQLEGQYDIETLARAITLETIRDTNLITIKMKSTNSEQAAEIVNKVGEKFVRFVSDKAREQATATTMYIEEQIIEEKQQLDNALIELKEFLAQPNGTSELSKELDAKLNLITDYKTKIVDSQLNKGILLESIQATERELNNAPEKLITTKSILEDNILSDVIKGSNNLTINQLANIRMENEEINPVYIYLLNKKSILLIELQEEEARIENLQLQIGQTQKEIDKLQIELADKKHEERLIDQKVQMSQNTYDAFAKKHEELRVTESSQIGESNMIVISRAFPTTTPVAPNKTLNVAIAGVLGIMMGVFAAFFIEYWQTSGKESDIKA
ncbi:GumC family protein [Alkaliphilus peptidifermentans]|uniref:Uncharacterized protein involved in exopolysaccharide biosynthesis n=1 Tax=Alkaliphilus peptidifermentans DSM 18978 TaxID=1120976 RepID=A0A1G5AI67_9FIRM|nr:Wzz/FepE/Etk N-terminal domain-containing protein [Alkaliphilus peptidifermentans]SCX77540.1 Uncharacterized protein involved in exopolysaccharide biosynthesis [Alkaliphilus peptidifermentans DSM 18978]